MGQRHRCPRDPLVKRYEETEVPDASNPALVSAEYPARILSSAVSRDVFLTLTL